MTRLIGFQLRLLLFALVPTFLVASTQFGFAECMPLFAVLAMVLELAATWSDSHARE